MNSVARWGIIQLAGKEFPSREAGTVSTSTSHQETRSLGLLAAVAIVGLAFFAATALLLPLISEYSLTADYISELVLGRYGYLQTAAFFAAGLGTLALAVGVREATNGSWGTRLGSALVGLYGVGLILAGILPADEIGPAGRVVSPTSVGTMHSVVSALAFVFVIAGMFVLSRTFKRDARWQAVWPWSLVLALATLIGVIVASPSEGPWVGLIQRTYIGTIIIWQVLVAFWLRSIAKGASAEQPPRVR
jgi:hypothetical membrane protein